MNNTLNKCNYCDYTGEATFCPNCTTSAIEQFKEAMKKQEAKTCKGRIKDSLASLNEDLTKLMSDPDSDEYGDDPALSIDTYSLTTVCLSWGGPSSYLEIKHVGSCVLKVTYRFSDWGDTATLPVYDTEPAYAYACSIVEGLE
jgi:uncharacterized Zn finger protein (UPF0148 family)